MKIYTKTGDAGQTGLFGGPRVRKDHARIEAFGTVDELNSHLGMVRTHSVAAAFDPLLRRVQCELFDLGAQLATPEAAEERITAGHVEALELEIDRHEATLTPLTCFILPAGTPLAAAVHVARTVCRRAERKLVELDRNEKVTDISLQYLNRLSDLLFVMCRSINKQAGRPDVMWENKAG